MKLLDWGYRIVTMLLLFAFTAAACLRDSFFSRTNFVGTVLYVATGTVLFLIVLVSGIAKRLPVKMVWCATIAWCALFAFWAWTDRASPFILHELHTLDPVGARLETRKFLEVSIFIFVAMTIWVLTFPLIHSLLIDSHRRRAISAIQKDPTS